MFKAILTFVLLLGLASAGMADTCLGNCGVLGPNGVVTTAPTGNSYRWISTSGGVGGAGQISTVGGTNGTSYTTSPFSANAGDLLTFYFDYVTSDGAGYADYAWAELVTSTDAHAAWLFTARTKPSGNISPGQGLPANEAMLIPLTTSIQPGTDWAPLGSSSGACYSTGCGNTGWVESDYSITTAGTYKLILGVTNWADQIYDSGMAFDGATIAGTPITPPTGEVPEPSAWILLGTACAGLLVARRRQSAR
jgi:hypothetical protein